MSLLALHFTLCNRVRFHRKSDALLRGSMKPLVYLHKSFPQCYNLLRRFHIKILNRSMNRLNIKPHFKQVVQFSSGRHVTFGIVNRDLACVYTTGGRNITKLKINVALHWVVCCLFFLTVKLHFKNKQPSSSSPFVALKCQHSDSVSRPSGRNFYSAGTK